VPPLGLEGRGAFSAARWRWGLQVGACSKARGQEGEGAWGEAVTFTAFEQRARQRVLTVGCADFHPPTHRPTAKHDNLSMPTSYLSTRPSLTRQHLCEGGAYRHVAPANRGAGVPQHCSRTAHNGWAGGSRAGTLGQSQAAWRVRRLAHQWLSYGSGRPAFTHSPRRFAPSHLLTCPPIHSLW